MPNDTYPDRGDLVPVFWFIFSILVQECEPENTSARSVTQRELSKRKGMVMPSAGRERVHGDRQKLSPSIPAYLTEMHAYRHRVVLNGG